MTQKQRLLSKLALTPQSCGLRISIPSPTQEFVITSSPDPHKLREFVIALVPGTRVVWTPNGTRGCVQPDRSILWDDGSRMDRRQMTLGQAPFIRDEAEWLGHNETLANMLQCLHLGCTLQRWEGDNCKQGHPEKLCPLALFPNSEPPAPLIRRRVARPVRLAADQALT